MKNSNSPKIDLVKNINLAYEAGSLRNIKRLWAQVLGDVVANNLEHSYRVVLVALMISRLEKKGNEERIMKMALFHDLCEARSTDIAFLHRSYVERHEEKATNDQLTGTVFEDMLPLLKEYEERKSIESQIVKDADDLDADLELQELIIFGNKVAEKFRSKNRIVFIKNKLYTNSAKKLFDCIIKTRPDEWQSAITSNHAKTRKDK